MRRLVSKHVAWLERLNIVLFAPIVATYILIGRLAALLIFSPALLGLSSHGLTAPEYLVEWYIPLLVAPVFETLLFQWLPISLSARLGQPLPVQLTVSATLFTLVHITSGVLATLSAIPAGLGFGYAYVCRRRKGLSLALFSAALAHFWVNAMILAIRFLTQ